MSSSAQRQLMLLSFLAANLSIGTKMCKLKHAAYVLCTTLLGSCGCLVDVPRVWEDFPGNIINPAKVTLGETHAPDYWARPTYARPIC
jgi:hypothetical protein